MAFTLEHFATARPFLYHLTSRQNICHIQSDMMLKPSSALYSEAGQSVTARTIRRGHRLIRIGERSIELRDQDPLHAGNIAFSDGWDIGTLVRHLDDHVFFWPGLEDRLVNAGQRHFERYGHENPVILRVAFQELHGTNNGVEPLFCQYNSGAPRCSRGNRIPRGPDTFLAANRFPLPPSRVVEVTFKATVRLPPSIQAGLNPSGPWQPLNPFMHSIERDPRP